jgi:hypothetical protein
MRSVILLVFSIILSVNMAFDDPEGHESDPNDVSVGKFL